MSMSALTVKRRSGDSSWPRPQRLALLENDMEKLPIEATVLWLVMIVMTVITAFLQHRSGEIAFMTWTSLGLLLLGGVWYRMRRR